MPWLLLSAAPFLRNSGALAAAKAQRAVQSQGGRVAGGKASGGDLFGGGANELAGSSTTKAVGPVVASSHPTALLPG